MTQRGTGQPDTAKLFDELLVTHVQSGDRRAGERLAARWYPRLMRAANRLLRDEEMAKSAVQDTWISILRSIASLRDPSRFAPWAFGILRRRCADGIRQAQARRSRQGETPAEPATPPVSVESIGLREAFDALPHDQQLAAQLFFVEGLTLAEIAEVQDIPTGTAKSRIFHARQKLKAALTGDDQ